MACNPRQYRAVIRGNPVLAGSALFIDVVGPRGFALLLAVALGCGCDGGNDAPMTALQRLIQLLGRLLASRRITRNLTGCRGVNLVY